MNKKLYLIRNILFCIVTLPVLYLLLFVDIWILYANFAIMLIVLLLVALVIINNVKKQAKVKYNRMYNKIFSLAMLSIFVIVMRAFFDSFLMMRYEGNIRFDEIYFSNNALLIGSLYFLLSIYNILLMYKKGQE